MTDLKDMSPEQLCEHSAKVRAEVTNRNSVRSRRINWWIPAFFVALLAFEFTRELLVVEENQPMVGDSLIIHGSSSIGYASARGQWKRTDGGSPLLPTTVTIDCWKHENMCIEASSTFIPNHRSASIDIDTFQPIQFEGNSISYENNKPGCAKYFVRIDLAQKRATATRQRVSNPDIDCSKLEEHMAMELASGYEQLNSEWMGDHYLPILNTIRRVAQ